MTDITQALLPNGRQQFFDANGAPLAGGSVGMYLPGTLDTKATYQDPLGDALNINPVPLDAAGSALIYGSGQFRQIVKNAAGSVIWDALTYGLIPSTNAATTGFGAQTPIASGVTVNLGLVASHNALVTGNANIAGFGNGASLASPIYYVQFDVGSKLVYDAGALVIPGLADLPCAAGDGVLVEFLGSSAWKVIAYFPVRGIFAFGQKRGIVAADTTDLGTLNTRNALVSPGVGVIHGFGASANILAPTYFVEFSTAVTLIYDPALFILPGLANITTVDGDAGIFEYQGGGVWRCTNYQRISGYPLVVDQMLQRTFVSVANGAFDFVLPAKVNASTRIKFTLCGPGGGGGGEQAGNNGGGSGGNAGAFWQGVLYGFVGGEHITGTLGAVGGAGGMNADGSAGTALTKFTYQGVDVISCAPGAGGLKNAGAPPAAAVVTQNLTGLTLEAELYNLGARGSPGTYAGSNVNVAGTGASTPLGSGGPSVSFVSGGAGQAGNNAQGWGAGGGGAAGSAAVTGGTGAGGYFLMELLSA